MNTEKAIKIIECLGWGYPEAEIKAAVKMAVKAMEGQKEYEESIQPVKVTADKVWNTFKCPNCQQIYGDDEYDVQTLNYCPHCGRPLIWENKL